MAALLAAKGPGGRGRRPLRQGCESRSDGVRRRFRRCLLGEFAARPDAESRSLVAAGEAPKLSPADSVYLFVYLLEKNQGTV